MIRNFDVAVRCLWRISVRNRGKCSAARCDNGNFLPALQRAGARPASQRQRTGAARTRALRALLRSAETKTHSGKLCCRGKYLFRCHWRRLAIPKLNERQAAPNPTLAAPGMEACKMLHAATLGTPRSPAKEPRRGERDGLFSMGSSNHAGDNDGIAAEPLPSDSLILYRAVRISMKFRALTQAGK